MRKSVLKRSNGMSRVALRLSGRAGLDSKPFHYITFILQLELVKMKPQSCLQHWSHCRFPKNGGSAGACSWASQWRCARPSRGSPLDTWHNISNSNRGNNLEEDEGYYLFRGLNQQRPSLALINEMCCTERGSLRHEILCLSMKSFE